MYGSRLGFVAPSDIDGLIVENASVSSRSWWEEPLGTIVQAGADWAAGELGGSEYGSTPPYAPGDGGGTWEPPWPIMTGTAPAPAPVEQPRDSELVNALTWGALALVGAKLVGVI